LINKIGYSLPEEEAFDIQHSIVVRYKIFIFTIPALILI
jgi:hypothetical protein